MLSPKQLKSGKCALLHASLLTAICVQTGTLANVWTWKGRYSTNIGNSKLGTSDNKVKDPVWTLDDFKDPAHMAAERARHTNAQKRPRTSHDGSTCLGLTYLRLSNLHLSPTQTQLEAMKGPCDVSKKRCAHTQLTCTTAHDCNLPLITRAWNGWYSACCCQGAQGCRRDLREDTVPKA